MGNLEKYKQMSNRLKCSLFSNILFVGLFAGVIVILNSITHMLFRQGDFSRVIFKEEGIHVFCTDKNSRNQEQVPVPPFWMGQKVVLFTQLFRWDKKFSLTLV